jgi:hypothetical protein
MMFVTKKAIGRRTMLRGIGAAVALPMLDSMVPAFTTLVKAVGKAKPRLGVVYMPNGHVMDNWTPIAVGRDFDFKPILKPLEPFRDRITVISGLDGIQGYANHAGAATRMLACVVPKPELGAEVQAHVSMDQVAALALGKETQLASLELGLESTESAGSCDPGHSCAYTNTISWRTATAPLPMENNPRVVFERLFGDTQSTDPKQRLARLAQKRSILDSVTTRVQDLGRSLGVRDRTKLQEYLESVRDAERRIQQAEAQNDLQLPIVDQPVGAPAAFEDHAKLMFDLMVLAYQSDLTRVITFMTGREYSGRTYPEIGCPEAHHPTSHHKNDPELMSKLTRIETLHSTLFAYYLEKLRNTPDGEGSLLDNVTIMFGCGMSDSDAHSFASLPILIAGGGAGQLKGNQHVRCAAGTPLANLHVTLLNMMEVSTDSFSNSTGRVNMISGLG